MLPGTPGTPTGRQPNLKRLQSTTTFQIPQRIVALLPIGTFFTFGPRPRWCGNETVEVRNGKHATIPARAQKMCLTSSNSN